MAAIHFTTIPFKTNTINRHKESHIFTKFVPVITTVYARLEVFCAFL